MRKQNNPISKQQVIGILKTIPDPELNISIWDLGLIYEVAVEQKTGNVRVLMTLTSIGCPLFATIQSVIEERLKEQKGVGSVTVDLTFDPPWSMDAMTEAAKAQLGLL